jgi:hypothetical protein
MMDAGFLLDKKLGHSTILSGVSGAQRVGLSAGMEFLFLLSDNCYPPKLRRYSYTLTR